MTATELPGRVDLSEHGIRALGVVHRNPTTSLLYTHSLAGGEGHLAEGGALAVDTGTFTGRSPKDKFLVQEPGSQDRIWWGEVNQPLSPEHFDGLREKVTSQLGSAESLYVVDAYAGADPAHRIGVRVITAHPYHALFAKTMFIELTPEEQAGFEPEALVLHAPDVTADPDEDGTRSGTFVVLHPGRTELLVGGTYYAGEIKKSIFTVMNDRLPLEGVFPMHCSANVGRDGRVAIFFGLSGTGKTTLSADPERSLIGDDEHGWGHTGVFNIEGGCYAKVIRLSPKAEPEIFRMTRTYGTILENVSIDENGVQARGDLECAAREAGRASVGGDLPDRRRVRDPAADREALESPGALLLPLRLHREARGNRDRRDRAAAHVLDLLRAAVPAAAATRLCTDARAEARGAWLAHLVAEHGLDGRAVRGGGAHADRRDAKDVDRCTLR
jgi:phosphoenolpyruvate carboxykinase (ATP)